jgi:hypothetical protein
LSSYINTAFSRFEELNWKKGKRVMGFEIEDGVLVKYDGDEEIVKIPEGVKTIYQISFQHVGSRFEQLMVCVD